MLDRISNIVDRIERSSHPFDRTMHIWVFQESLDWLLLQHGFFKLALLDSTTSKWNALNGLIQKGSEIIDMGKPVLGAFFNTYGATGTFILNRRIGRPSGADYFMVLADELDPPFYWPLIIHELSHCWLSSQNIIEEISSQINPEIEQKFIERRVEEALCDAVAASLMGPSYVYSYINRLWSGFAIPNSPEYPSTSFRLELMIRILKQANHAKIRDLETLIEETSSKDWGDEAIADSMSLIEDFTSTLPFSVEHENLDTDIEKIEEFVDDPPQDIRNLYHAGWTLLNSSSRDTYSKDFTKINHAIQETLERGSSAINTKT
jgi:hypothetical protein